MAKTFYILDGHAQIYRAYYAPFRDLTSPSGEPTRATYVFTQMLLNLLRDRKPDYFAMAMDVSDKTVFRCEIDPQYKANRDPAPEDLHLQADRIVTIVTALGVPIHRVDGFEADDVMATIVDRLADRDIDIYLVSRDKDLEQLMDDHVRMFNPSKDEIVDATTMLEKKGYSPAQAVDVQTLAGDSTDNIPGVPGIGIKTAAKLVNQYGSAQAVIDNAEKLTPKMRERVRAFADQLAITRRLVTLRRDVPMEFDLEACRTDRFRVDPLREIFDELGFHRLHESLDRLRGQPSSAPESERAATPDAPEPKPPIERGRYEAIDTTAKLEAFVDKLAEQDVFAFDTETTGLNPVRADLVGLSFAWRAGEAYYLPVRSAMGEVLPIDAVIDKLGPIFANAAVGKVGQNIKFDILVLRQVGIRVAGVVFDTMLASALLDPLAPSHRMDSLVKAHIGHDMIPISDLIGKGRNQITIDLVAPDLVSEYAAEDADFTWRLFEVLGKRMKGSNVEPLFRQTELPLIDVLVEMEHNGIAIDVDRLATLGAEMVTRIAELQGDIHRVVGHGFNIDSPKQLAVVLFDELGLDVIRKTKTGRSTDADTLSTLEGRTDHPLPGLVRSYRELTKLKGTYVDTLPKMVTPRTGRIHTSFHQTGAVTGRLSSSDPNLQNIPVRTEMGRRIRAAFVAGVPDNVLLTADYSQIELRLLAHFCKDSALIAAFAAGQDIHRAVAAQVNGVPVDEVTSEQRSAAKAVNFGIIYGQSAFGLSRTLGIPVGEAKAFIDMYFMRYPGIRLFIDRCIADARTHGFAQTMLGRRRPVPELLSRNRMQVAAGERIAVNTVVQGSAADLIKRAMIGIHREITIGKLPCKMLSQVHDELIFEVPKRDVEAVAACVKDKMESALPLDVPIVVDVAWDFAWAKG